MAGAVKFLTVVIIMKERARSVITEFVIVLSAWLMGPNVLCNYLAFSHMTNQELQALAVIDLTLLYDFRP